MHKRSYLAPPSKQKANRYRVNILDRYGCYWRVIVDLFKVDINLINITIYIDCLLQFVIDCNKYTEDQLIYSSITEYSTRLVLNKLAQLE